MGLRWASSRATPTRVAGAHSLTDYAAESYGSFDFHPGIQSSFMGEASLTVTAHACSICSMLWVNSHLLAHGLAVKGATNGSNLARGVESKHGGECHCFGGSI